MIPSIGTYFGGKGASGVAQTIINEQPPHDVYGEIFLGGGTVMRTKKPAKKNIGIELNEETFFKWCKALYPGVPLPLNKYTLLTIDGNKYTVINTDAISYLKSIRNKNPFGVEPKKVLLYCDPPYLNATRTSNHKYQHELIDSDHEEFLKIVTKLPYLVQVSCYDNELYKRYLTAKRGWRKIKFTSTTHGGKNREETLYMNYPAPVELFDYSFLGSDYRERENISRKIKRHVAKFQELPVLERKAILVQLNAIADQERNASPVQTAMSADTGEESDIISSTPAEPPPIYLQPECIICGRQGEPKEENPYLLNGFIDKVEDVFVHFLCGPEFYHRREGRNLYMEMPAPTVGVTVVDPSKKKVSNKY